MAASCAALAGCRAGCGCGGEARGLRGRAGRTVGVSGGAECGSGLGGVLRGLVEPGYGFDERGQLGDEHDGSL